MAINRGKLFLILHASITGMTFCGSKGGRDDFLMLYMEQEETF